ncbi:MAG: hypothetical protein ACFFCW_41775 [Candidatus Hodarchaeota archaeon]
MTKDEILTAIAIIILLFSVMIDWNVYSWLILVGIVVIIFAWYFRKKDKVRFEPNSLKKN